MLLLCLPPIQSPTAISIMQQRELLKLCDSHLWNAAVLPTTIRIKSTLNCFRACRTFSAFVKSKYHQCTQHFNYSNLLLVPNCLRAFEYAIMVPKHFHPILHYWLPLNFQASFPMLSLQTSLFWSSSCVHHLTFLNVFLLCQNGSSMKGSPLLGFSLLYPEERHSTWHILGT